DVAISTFGGSSISLLRNKLAVIPTPTITDFSPLSGYLNSTVTINGTNFSSVPSENTVKFNGVDATVVISTATQITTTVPASATTGLITVNVGNQTATSASNFTVLIDNTPPVLSTNSTPGTVNAGASLTVTATFSDPETGILSASLSYRPITSAVGVSPPISLSMARTSGNAFTATIPATDISELGVEYQFLAYNGVGMGSNISQKFRPAIRHTTGLTLSSYPSSAAGTDVSNYRMIAIPLVLDNNTANGIFSAALGNYDPTKWRLFLYTGSATSELNGNTTLFPGVGYWFISSKATSLSTGPGSTVDLSATSEFSIVLNPGWNQIGNPYNFNISWADVVAGNPSEAANLGGNSSKVRVYRGTIENTDVLKAMEGGFVKYLGTTTASIRIPTTKNTSIQGRVATGTSGNVIAEGSSWELPINLRNGNVDYNLGGVGMHPEAKTGFDFHDDFNAPRFIEYLEMVFPKKYLGMTYTKDVVPPAEDYSWLFSVESNLKDPVTIMSWDQSLIAGRNMYLLDVKQHKITSMNAADRYSFDQRVSSDFKIIVGNEEYIRKELIPSMAILQEPYPNPFASEATIEFALPDDVSTSGAELAIYNMQGARITLTTLTTPGPGRMQWRPEENSSGLYLVILKAGSQTISRKILKR
ncbi:MAG TPA: IPT/TIG domain-containing protein, partial [Cyclobacteriaceae bacterium]|nr:IPT/TIG domain-containing protein [Cyclobacteriaceae bacterium]